MPKGPRLNIPNGTYHVMARGNRKGDLFEDDRDRVKFNAILKEAAERYDVRVFAGSLLGNHYHHVVHAPHENLPHFMRYLNGSFSLYSNRRHRRIGHLFNEPYKPVLIEGDYHLRVAIGYVLMNPVNHGFVSSPADWKWSSYRATVGLEPAPDYLDLDWLAAEFPAATREQSVELLQRYLTSRTWVEGEEWLDKPACGSTDFERDLRLHVGEKFFMSALPRSYRAVGRPPLTELFGSCMSKSARNKQMLRAHVVYGYTIAEIARALYLHPGSVSRIVAALRRKARA